MDDPRLLAREWAAARMFLLFLAFSGLMASATLGMVGYFMITRAVDKLVFMWGAMGFLLVSALGVNLAARFDIRRNGPYSLFMALLVGVVAGLLYLYTKLDNWGFDTTWPLLASIAFASTVGGAMLRLFIVKRSLDRILTKAMGQDTDSETAKR